MTEPVESTQLKNCCADLYQSDLAVLLLGDSFHPGGLSLTERLGTMLNLDPGLRVLDVASGKGESAVFLARQFGCEVLGVDFGADNVRHATARAEAAEVTKLVSFVQGDAERLEIPDASFDAVICECAFCTFPDKPAAAHEFARLLRNHGKVGLSDLTRTGPLPSELAELLAWIACIADARPVADYAGYLECAGFEVAAIESHDEALAQMARDIQAKLMGLELMVKLKKLALPGVEFAQANLLARGAAKAIKERVLGYSLIVADLNRCR